MLWIGGYLIGPDRAAGESPFGFGDDATVGLSTVMQLAGELMAGSAALLQAENRYAAAALIRQLVEVEYLAWAFAESFDEAMSWLRSTREERLEMWQPGHMRKRAAGRFRASDYANHCERGGHPTPDANYLLPGHVNDPPGLWWFELASHGASIHDYFAEAAQQVGYPDEVMAEDPLADQVAETLAVWRQDDPLPLVLDAERDEAETSRPEA